MYLYYPIAIYLAYRVYLFSIKADQAYQQAISYLDISSQTEMAWKSLLEKLTLHLYDGTSEVKENILIANEQANAAIQNANIYTLYFFILSISYFLFIRYIKKSSNRYIILNCVLMGTICLSVGLLTTMLNLTAFREIPVIGLVVFKFESKSILSILFTFIENKQYVLFLLVLLFSVVVPSLKLIVSTWLVIANKLNLSSRLIAFINVISKWSMTDVFVVAILLAFFTMNVDESTHAWLGHGLYFFAAYSILSIVISQQINTSINNNVKDSS